MAKEELGDGNGGDGNGGGNVTLWQPETSIQRIREAKGKAFTVRSAAQVAAILKKLEDEAL